MDNRSILFVGQAFYNAWYLSRELRLLGWTADLINIDPNKGNVGYYHGQDFSFSYTPDDLRFRVDTYLTALGKYEIFHFSNTGGIYFLNDFEDAGRFKTLIPVVAKLTDFLFAGRSVKDNLNRLIKLGLVKKKASGELHLTKAGFWLYRKIARKVFSDRYGKHWDVKLLKLADKKIGYANNGCLDGALKSSFEKWGPINTCAEVCNFYNNPAVCSDHLNKVWGEFRNSMADYQCNIGCNKVDYNDVPEVFESPWFYCLDTNFWNPHMLIPSNYLLPYGRDTVKIYHAVGNFESRKTARNKTIKCTHIYLDLIDRYKEEGLPVELVFIHGLPNKIARYYQAQADIVVDMLTFGFFGANIREAMMLGKPAVCFLRPEWLEKMREEIPGYVDELPVVSATPETVDGILRELILNKEKREEIGRRSREFAVKWHGSEIAAKYFDQFLPLVADNRLDKKQVFEIQEKIYN